MNRFGSGSSVATGSGVSGGLNDNGWVSTSAVQLLHVEMVQAFISKRREDATSEDRTFVDAPETQSYHLLHHLGFQVGVRLTERLLHNRPLRIFNEDAAVAFIAAELWPAAFEKRPEGPLRRFGPKAFKLWDSEFHWLRSGNFIKSAANPSKQIEARPQQAAANASLSDGAPIGPDEILYLPSGIIRGALEALGHPGATVTCTLDGGQTGCRVLFVMDLTDNQDQNLPTRSE